MKNETKSDMVWNQEFLLIGLEIIQTLDTNQQNIRVMRFIKTRIHGIVDYLVGVILIISPWLFGFAIAGAAQWVPVALGLGALLYSLMTDYELGLVKVISMKVHLMIDLFVGIFLAVSPWLFGFADEIYLPHLILGILEIGASLVTRQSSDEQEVKNNNFIQSSSSN